MSQVESDTGRSTGSRQAQEFGNVRDRLHEAIRPQAGLMLQENLCEWLLTNGAASMKIDAREVV